MARAPKTATVGDVLGAAGAPLCLTYLGKEHPVSPPTLRVLGRLENLVFKLASARVASMKDVIPDDEYQQYREDLAKLVRTDEHKTFGKLWIEQVNADGGLRGMFAMLHCCLEEARENAKNPRALPDPIPFADMAKVLRDSPDAREVAIVVLPDFFRAGLMAREPEPEKMAAVESMVKEFRDRLESALAKA